MRRDDVLLSVTACALSEQYELRFPGEQEADAGVRHEKSGKEAWRWSLGRGFADEAHSIVFAHEECVRWSVPRDYRDESGARVPSGRYSVDLPALPSPRHDNGTFATVD